MKSKKSIRTEYTKDEKKQIEKAAGLEKRSVKQFIEMAVIAATLQTLTKKS